MGTEKRSKRYREHLNRGSIPADRSQDLKNRNPIGKAENRELDNIHKGLYVRCKLTLQLHKPIWGAQNSE